ncbi:hypothetical protein SUGI_0252330 [Cryptomeria japonica]|nr:hypothetical protein SUGI_0252330 [Cryptomeria japonica]
MQPNTTFHINDGEDASVVQNMLRLLGVHVFLEVVVENIAANRQMDSTAKVDMEQVATNIDEDAVDTLDESLGLPSERIAPSWVVEGATNLGVELEGEDERGTSSLPSPPEGVIPKMLHYYADCGDSENGNVVSLTQEATQDCNVEKESLMSQEKAILLQEKERLKELEKREKTEKLQRDKARKEHEAEERAILEQPVSILSVPIYISFSSFIFLAGHDKENEFCSKNEIFMVLLRTAILKEQGWHSAPERQVT